MASRRQFILGTGLLGAGSVGGWFAATGELPPISELVNDIKETVSGSTLDIDESIDFGQVSVTATDVALADSLTVGSGQSSANWEAPDGGVIVLWRIEAENDDINSHDAPQFNPRKYTQLQKSNDVIEVGGVNDIRVYGNSSGGTLGSIRETLFTYSDQVTIAGNTLQLWPSTMNTDPEVNPNSSISGWVPGLIETGQTPALRIQTENNDVRWEVDREAQEITPSQNTTIEI